MKYVMKWVFEALDQGRIQTCPKEGVIIHTSLKGEVKYIIYLQFAYLYNVLMS